MTDSKRDEFNASQILGSWEKLPIPELIREIKGERRWLKKVLGILLYHEYMCNQFEDKRNIKWTMLKTATALGMSVGAVSESLSLAKALPHIANYEKITRDQALKRMREKKNKDNDGLIYEERRRA